MNYTADNETLQKGTKVLLVIAPCLLALFVLIMTFLAGMIVATHILEKERANETVVSAEMLTDESDQSVRSLDAHTKALPAI